MDQLSIKRRENSKSSTYSEEGDIGADKVEGPYIDYGLFFVYLVTYLTINV
jgi:hypothetical protein